MKRDILPLVGRPEGPVSITCHWIIDISNWTCWETGWKNKIVGVGFQKQESDAGIQMPVIDILENFLQIKRGNEKPTEKKI